MHELTSRPDEDRRSPVGDFMLGAMASSAGAPVAHGELLTQAADERLSVSQVLAWIAVAKEGGLVEELTIDDRPALRLTAAGIAVVHNDRRNGSGRS